MRYTSVAIVATAYYCYNHQPVLDRIDKKSCLEDALPFSRSFQKALKVLKEGLNRGDYSRSKNITKCYTIALATKDFLYYH